MRVSYPGVAVLPVDWATFHRRGKAVAFETYRSCVATSPALEGRQEPRPASESAIKCEFARASPIIGRHHTRIRLDGSQNRAVAVDARKAFGTMGLTSLMAMELRNRLEAALDRPLSATLAWNLPDIQVLVAPFSGRARQDNRILVFQPRWMFLLSRPT